MLPSTCQEGRNSWSGGGGGGGSDGTNLTCLLGRGGARLVSARGRLGSTMDICSSSIFVLGKHRISFLKYRNNFHKDHWY